LGFVVADVAHTHQSNGMDKRRSASLIITCPQLSEK
jgi:hypothetical protein